MRTALQSCVAVWAVSKTRAPERELGLLDYFFHPRLARLLNVFSIWCASNVCNTREHVITNLSTFCARNFSSTYFHIYFGEVQELVYSYSISLVVYFKSLSVSQTI